MTRFQHRFSFVVMAVLIFIGVHFLLWSWVSSGPNLDLDLGWLELHRHVDAWTIEGFHPFMLIVIVSVSVLLTWILSKMLRHRMA